MNPPGTGLGKNAEKARQMSGAAETSRRGNAPGRGYGIYGAKEKGICAGQGSGAGQGANVKTEIKMKEAPVVDKTGAHAKMVVGTTIEP